MTSLVTVGNKGERALMCDSRCYNAIGTDCVCICDYLNHGVGLGQALANSTELAKRLIRQFDWVQAPLIFGENEGHPEWCTVVEAHSREDCR